MIEALFSQPNYLVAKKAMDVARLRQEAIAGNIANLETPGYRRVDVAPEFIAELHKAAAAGNPRRISELQPKINVDQTAMANSQDGNTVSLESELLRMSQNTVENALQSQLISGTLMRMRMAITGRTM